MVCNQANYKLWVDISVVKWGNINHHHILKPPDKILQVSPQSHCHEAMCITTYLYIYTYNVGYIVIDYIYIIHLYIYIYIALLSGIHMHYPFTSIDPSSWHSRHSPPEAVAVARHHGIAVASRLGFTRKRRVWNLLANANFWGRSNENSWVLWWIKWVKPQTYDNYTWCIWCFITHFS
jgi:hypothetical protein